MSPLRPDPVATYRLQLTPDFGFAEAIPILDHLDALGISHLYLSPIGTAMPGSTHGYDWVPPPQVAAVLGGIDGLRALRAAAAERSIGIIIDIVPNHTGVAQALRNPWFADLLRHGSGSRYASYFDVDFSADNGCEGAIALPVLASDGDLSPLTVDDHGILRYHDHQFPTAPGTLGGSPIEVHARQHYRLVPWDSGLIGYRRFFTVNELAGLRQEDSAVYDATHQWLRDLMAADLIDGVRVDHPDGLWDPSRYLDRLRGDLGTERLLFIEKILAPDEPLEPTLPVEGTTGYDQMRLIDALFTAPSGIVELSEIHERTTGIPGDAQWLRHTEHDRKITTLATMFPAEHRRLVRAITHSDPAADTDAVGKAVAELIAELGVYRADYPSLRPRLITTAERIAERSPHLADALDTIVAATATSGAPSSRLAQTCGAVTAKSVEDSLFYRTARLVSAQEVGSDPTDPTLSLNGFHHHNALRAARWPRAMTAGTTHDTKRGEDVRARIALLAQVPERWSLLVRHIWEAAPPPENLTGYFLLQNMIGVWPVADEAAASAFDTDIPAPVDITDELRDRLCAYAQKAAREAGIKTTWTEVNTEFEAALDDWITRLTTGEMAETITAFVSRIGPAWRQESLARKALTILGPGLPDIYQGTEWFEDSLVDPDNRRPVDYTRSIDHPKVALVTAALGVRRRHPAAFGLTGDYRAIYAEGPGSDHVIAFARGAIGGPAEVVVVTARFTHSLSAADAGSTTITLPDGTWSDVLGGDDHGDGPSGVAHSGVNTLASLRAHGPVAILERVV